MSYSVKRCWPAGLLALLLSTCGGPAVDPRPPRSCPFVRPAACPSPAPSYAREVAPVIARRCAPGCHEPGGLARVQPLNTYAQVFYRRGAMLGQVYRCQMPPIDEPPLLPEEGRPLLDWLACNAPDN
jgi:hypothetical protein